MKPNLNQWLIAGYLMVNAGYLLVFDATISITIKHHVDISNPK